MRLWVSWTHVRLVGQNRSHHKVYTEWLSWSLHRIFLNRCLQSCHGKINVQFCTSISVRCPFQSELLRQRGWEEFVKCSFRNSSNSFTFYFLSVVLLSNRIVTWVLFIYKRMNCLMLQCHVSHFKGTPYEDGRSTIHLSHVLNIWVIMCFKGMS